jgi:hypothetical protein
MSACQQCQAPMIEVQAVYLIPSSRLNSAATTVTFVDLTYLETTMHQLCLNIAAGPCTEIPGKVCHSAPASSKLKITSDMFSSHSPCPSKAWGCEFVMKSRHAVTCMPSFAALNHYVRFIINPTYASLWARVLCSKRTGCINSSRSHQVDERKLPVRSTLDGFAGQLP